MTILELLAADAAIGDDVDRIVVVAPHPDDEVLADCSSLTAVERGLAVRGPSPSPTARRHTRTRPGRAGPLSDVVNSSRPSPSSASVRTPSTVSVCRTVVSATTSPRSWTPSAPISTGTLLVVPSVHDWHPDHEACGEAIRRLPTASWTASWSSLFWAHHHPERLVSSRPRLLRLEGTERQRAARQRAVSAQHRSQFRHPAGRGAPILSP